ncbi:hypothetical protein BC629DRAFT_1651865 [Irpex lacteus]|nr:hypothetical protein BC629DRAFT_1651865 [Irpex lacteus]
MWRTRKKGSLVVTGHDAQGGAYVIVCPAGHAELGRTPEPRRGVGRRREQRAEGRGRRGTSRNRIERAADNERGRVFLSMRAPATKEIEFEHEARWPLVATGLPAKISVPHTARLRSLRAAHGRIVLRFGLQDDSNGPPSVSPTSGTRTELVVLVVQEPSYQTPTPPAA